MIFDLSKIQDIEMRSVFNIFRIRLESLYEDLVNKKYFSADELLDVSNKLCETQSLFDKFYEKDRPN